MKKTLLKFTLILILSTSSKLHPQTCLGEISWELDCLKNLNIGFKCTQSGTNTYKTIYRTSHFYQF